MFCKNCGAQISDDAAFCDKCGQNIKASSTSTKPKRKKKGIFIGLLAVVLVILAIAVLEMSGSSEPIVGKWNATVSVKDSEVIPIVSSKAYINVKGNGTFYMWFDDDLSYSGEWEPYNGPLSSDVGTPYTLNFEDSKGKGLLVFDNEKERINVMMGDIMIVFEK